MADAHDYNFSDDSRLCIAQARFEALRLGSRVVQPAHLILGVTKAIGQSRFERLFPDPTRFAALCRSLGAEVPAAPVAAEDVSYSEEAIAAVAGAHHAASSNREGAISALHLLLGVHRPHGGDDRPLPPSTTAAVLDAAGISAAVLETVLATEPQDG